jgi:ring-1,2-phenylacetyl-CoA epoxidase subunit PaaE
MVTYTLKIVAIIRETADTCTICFKQPGLKKIKYLPGQYVTVVVNINGRKYKRPYSLSSAPGIDATINITVKRLERGVVSSHLVDIVKEGDMLEVMEPMGNFVYDANVDGSKEVFLWGAGSGITPLMSILKTALQHNLNSINLFYCNKTVDQTIFYDQLLTLGKTFPNRLSLNLFCTAEHNVVTTSGRINEDHVRDAMTNVDIVNTLHYTCGPVGLKETVKTVTAEMGLSIEHFFSEDFEHVINEEELKDIKARVVHIAMGTTTSNIEVVRGKSILEAGLDIGLDLPYSCQTGTCTLCKATLLSGNVKKIGKEKPDNELEENEHLLCCSYPLTDDILFKIN